MFVLFLYFWLSINVKVYFDWLHLEIFSYGPPLSVQTKEDFLRGVSVPINPELASVFMKMDKTEASGKGINTIVEKYGIDVFEFSETHLTIKIPYNKKVLEIQNVPQNVPQKTDEQKIIEIIKNNPKLTRKEMDECIGKTVKTVQRIINEKENLLLTLLTLYIFFATCYIIIIMNFSKKCEVFVCMKNIYNMLPYFESIKYHIYFFDVLIKKSSITKEALLEEQDIAYMTYKRAKDFDSNAGYKLITKLDNYFKINPLNATKKEEYENTLNLLINRFYYRSDKLYELEPILVEYIKENNYLQPLFTLMLLLIKLVKVKNPKKVIEENRSSYNELKDFAKNFFVSPFTELFSIIEILYHENKLYNTNFTKDTSENMKGLLYNSCAVNAILAQNYSLSLYYCIEGRKYLIKDNNFNRLIFLNLIYFTCLNKIGEYEKCFEESRSQLTYLTEITYDEELIRATQLHYYTACLGLKDYTEVISSITRKDVFTSNDYIFILLSSYQCDRSLYKNYLLRYSIDKEKYNKKQNYYINLIIEFLSGKNKALIKDQIFNSELNIGLKEILLKK